MAERKQKRIVPGLHEQNLPAYSFSVERNAWLPQPTTASSIEINALPDRLVVVSWNILFDFHHQERIFTTARRPLLLRVLEETNADIIGLQEVTTGMKRPSEPFFLFLKLFSDFIEYLKLSQTIRERYVLSDTDGKTLTQYGQLILAKKQLSCTFSLLHYSSMKRAVIAHFRAANHELILPCLHLTSDRSSGDFVAGRKKQMELLLSLLSGMPSTMPKSGLYNSVSTPFSL